MKKLYRKGTVHPSPPTISGHLSFLPAAILTLTAALSPEDKEILAYLISCSSNNIIQSSQKATSFCSTSAATKKANSNTNTPSNSNNYINDPHPPLFTCGCFWCYMSYWVRWDASPNRHLIHEIIDAFEDWLLMQGKSCNNSGKKYRRDKRRKGNNGFISSSGELERSEMSLKDESSESNSVEENSGGGGGGEEEKGSMSRFVSFIGERIWGVLG